jgi:hypothetical protein
MIAARVGNDASEQHIDCWYARNGQWLKATADGQLGVPLEGAVMPGRLTACVAVLMYDSKYNLTGTTEHGFMAHAPEQDGEPFDGTNLYRGDVKCSGAHVVEAALPDDRVVQAISAAAAADALDAEGDEHIEDAVEDVTTLTSWTMGTYNCNSLGRTTAAVVLRLQRTCTVFGVTEVWRPTDLEEHEAMLAQRGTVFTERTPRATGNRGGGVMLIVDKSHAATRVALPDDVLAAVEAAGGDVVAATVDDELTVSCLYLPPHSSAELAAAAVILLMQHCTSIIGDVNMTNAL